jgi:dihydrofolate synthase/folylpolyglutamate synthase
MNLEKTLNYLYSLTTKGIKLGLGPAKAFLDKLDNPQDHFHSVHIAGTNGKGTVAHLVYSVLRAAGIRTGLYTSPHINRFNERVIVNGRTIPDRFISDFVVKHRTFFEKLNLTFFEITTAMAFDYLKRQRVEWAVIETGLGGRLDTTNVVNPAVCAITDISVDHEHYLGNTITSIAREKAGIIKKCIPLVIGIRNQKARSVVLKSAENYLDVCQAYGLDIVDESAVSSTLNIGTGDFTMKSLRLPLAGSHQPHNALIALGIVRNLGINIPPDIIKRGFKRVRLPGRLELRAGKPDILFDVAHNEAGITALDAHLKKYFKNRKTVIVIGFMADKRYEAMGRILLSKGRELILVKPRDPRAADPAIIQRGLKAGTVIPEVKKAFNLAKRKAGIKGLVVVTGSFVTVGQVYDKQQRRVLSRKGH